MNMGYPLIVKNKKAATSTMSTLERSKNHIKFIKKELHNSCGNVVLKTKDFRLRKACYLLFSRENNRVYPINVC